MSLRDTDLGARRTTSPAWWLLAVLWGGYLVLDQMSGFTGPTHTLLKGLLMPGLLLCLWLTLRERTPPLLIAALVLATVGDVGLEYDATFLVGMAGFFAMQVCYSIGFLRLGAWPGVRERWPIAAGYLVFWVVANVILGPRLGDLQVPIAVYSLALCLMAIISAGLGLRTGLGGLLFLVSDMLIGLDLAELDFAGRGLIVMVTYLAAQYLLATGWALLVDRRAAVPT